MPYCEEQSKLTNFGNNTTDDELLLASSLDSLTEVLVVPGVDLTLATDKGSVGVHVGDLLEKETVGAGVRRGSQDGRQVKDVANGRVRKHVVAEVIGAEVTDNLGQTDLVIDDQKSLQFWVSFDSAAVWILGDLQPCPCPVCSTPERERKGPTGKQSERSWRSTS